MTMSKDDVPQSRFEAVARIGIVAGVIAGSMHLALLLYHGREYDVADLPRAMYLWLVCWVVGAVLIVKKHGNYRAVDLDERELTIAGRSGRIASFCAYLTGCAMTVFAIVAAKFPDSISPDIVAWSVFAMLLINSTAFCAARLYCGARN